MSENFKHYASISLDLDNQWSYMKIHGDENWQDFPSYLNVFIPEVLKALEDLNIHITFFIVGQDAALEKNCEYLKLITEYDHEVGNHSFNHESWLHLYSKEEIENEIKNAEQVIVEATGEKPVGFRGPGFSWSKDLLNVLKNNGYIYDASTLPTYIGPLARMYYFRHSNLSKDDRKQRGELFGTFKDGLRPVKPFYWDLNGNSKLLEIPVSTIPVLKIPFHLSYLLYISRYSGAAMMYYLKTALRMCKITNTNPSILLHPLDIIGGDLIPQLKFFPGMDISSETKLKMFKEIIEVIKKDFEIINMSTHAKKIMNSPLKNLKPENK